MKIAFAASEAYPFAKTGGLGDVIGALPKALKELGEDVKVFLPKYAQIDHSLFDLSYDWSIGSMPIRVAGRIHNVDVYLGYLPNSSVEIYFLDCPYFFNRPKIYTSDPDEDERFILYSKAVIEALQHLKWQPDVIHCNDWQTGLIPLYIKDNYNWDRFFHRTATVMSIHNVGYQGRFPPSTVGKAEVRLELFYPNSSIEVWKSFCFLKTGLMYADVINTVSKTYAQEITTSEYGAGLEGVLRYRINDFFGIVNGVDYSIWNPTVDKFLPFRYSEDAIESKTDNKKYLLGASHLPYKENVPLIGIISRLVAQKGFDLFEKAAHKLMQLPAQWVILGTGANHIENLFRSLAFTYPDKVSITLDFNDKLSHLIEAGSDIFLMPSQYEPCGLNQIYSLKYGTVPIVRATGGLADTVQDWREYFKKGLETGTGFSFADYTPEALYSTVKRAVETYTNDKNTWRKIMLNGMEKDYSWNVSALQYIELYKKALFNRGNR